MEAILLHTCGVCTGCAFGARARAGPIWVYRVLGNRRPKAI